MTVLKKYHHANTMLPLVATFVLFFTLSLTTWILITDRAISSDKPQGDLLQEKEDYYPAPPSPFLQEEEIVIIQATTSEAVDEVLPVTKVLFEYVKVTGGCGPHFEGECLNVRSGPGVEYPVVSQLRNDVILKVGGKVTRGEETWFKIVFDEWLRYPNRVKGEWYVAAEYVEVLWDEGIKTLEDSEQTNKSKKEIHVSRGEQKLYAYEDGELFMEVSISTGRSLTPTPRGNFTIYRKTPSRYMQGPIPEVSADRYYDLPGIPWNLYFTHEGAVIHGAYWHTSFGSRYSNGCVNLTPDDAEKLYYWAETGTKVIVRD